MLSISIFVMLYIHIVQYVVLRPSNVITRTMYLVMNGTIFMTQTFNVCIVLQFCNKYRDEIKVDEDETQMDVNIILTESNKTEAEIDESESDGEKT